MIGLLYFTGIYLLMLVAIIFFGDIFMKYSPIIMIFVFLSVFMIRYFSKFKYKRVPKTLFEKINNQSYLIERKYRKYIGYIWNTAYLFLIIFLYRLFLNQ